ncbi:MAG: alpha/beta hydrolase [Chloroflexota bacterium]|nr:alpha/beta hydrolase [Chloroflexota bacterium]
MTIQTAAAAAAKRGALREDVVRLKDGRRLGYAEYGDADGAPVIFFNGAPATRIQGAMVAEAAVRSRVRLICPDRPGYGLSDPNRGRLLLDWPTDVVQLADGLGIARFAVVGHSTGGPHAAACAHRIPNRLTGVAISSGAGPFGPTAGTTPKFRQLMRLVAKYPSSVQPVLWLLVRALHRWPDGTVKRLSATECVFDQEVLRDYWEIYRDDKLEAVRQGTGGFLGDLTVLSRPWGFRVEDISVPVHLWHGELDDTVAPEVGRYMAKTIPDCRATFVPGAGHLLFARHMDAILAALTSA